MTFSPFLVANARHVARDDADRGPLALRSARLALWGFLWVDAAGSERTLATRRELAPALRRLGASLRTNETAKPRRGAEGPSDPRTEDHTPGPPAHAKFVCRVLLAQ